MPVSGERMRVVEVPWAGGTKVFRLPVGHLTAEIKFTDLPSLPDPAAALVAALDNPIGSRPLRDLVWPGARIALLTGDRITDLMLGSRDGLGHVILDYLNAAGVPDKDVTLVFAPGTHPADDAEIKLGESLIGRVGHYVRHDAARESDLAFIGYTPHGNAVWINRHVAEADVVVGFGEISPNTHGGWCGGGKIILPGVAGFPTVEHNHRMLMLPEIPLGLSDGDLLRLDIEEAADLAGLTFKIDVLVNSDAQMVAVYAGDFRAEHRAALATAREIWMTRMQPTDIAVFYPGDRRERCLEYSLFLTINAADLATKPDGIILFCLSAVDGYAKGSGLPYSPTLSARDALKLPAEAIARDMIYARGNIRTASMHFAARRVLERKRVWLVCDGIDPAEGAEFGFEATYHDFDAALAAALAEKGPDATLATSFPRGLTWRQMPWREG